jgi:hypothetical protein
LQTSIYGAAGEDLMTHARKRSLALYVSGASALTLAISTPAFAQNGAAKGTDTSSTDAASSDADAIVVTGIRASLESALKIKRDAQGVVDAISAEDIGKFPETNLAESLQRITVV